MVAAETAYLEAAGIEVAVAAGPACATPVEQALLSPQSWIELALAAAGSGADTLLFSCAGIQIAAVLDEIEQRTGRPVVTSNQALLWFVLRTIGHPDRPVGYGRLLAGEWGRRRAQPACRSRSVTCPLTCSSSCPKRCGSPSNTGEVNERAAISVPDGP